MAGGIVDGILRNCGSEYDFPDEIGAWFVAIGRASPINAVVADTASIVLGSSKTTKEKE